MAAIRRADASWTGKLAEGHGTVTASTSHAFKDLPVTWGSRTEAADGRTSPEELIAAAHATCFAMAFSGDLGRNGTPPDRLEVSVTVTFDKLEKWTIVSSAIAVRGWVPEIDPEAFTRIAEGTRDNCPVSRALKGNVELSVEATLER
jgi:osmotically inducible protein OsmC